MRRRRNLRLIEWQRHNLVAPQIADVSDVDRQIVARLPLNIQRLVHRVRQFVLAVVVRKRK